MIPDFSSKRRISRDFYEIYASLRLSNSNEMQLQTDRVLITVDVKSVKQTNGANSY